MDDERARILRMVAEGAITPEEAADLLEALQPATAPAGDTPPVEPAMPSWGGWPPPGESPGPRRNRHLIIQVRDEGESRVNLRIPLGLTRAAGKFIPRQAQGFLSKYDINLQEFLENAGNVESGTVLEVRDGENRVLIAVE